MSLTLAFRRLRITAEDRLRCSGALRSALGRSRLWFARRAVNADPQAAAQAIDRLCAAARLVSDGPVTRRIEAEIHRHLDRLDLRQLDWPKSVAGIDDRRICKATFLKPYVGPR